MYIMKYVYESPDGGHTVYRRESGQVQRTLHRIDSVAREKLEAAKEIQLWKDICTAAKHNPALQSALDQARIIYELSKQQ